MKRDLEKLATRYYDLLIIGGGIQGACVAREASEAGLSVALVERQDFGAATSHNSFKLIHAGFRYLQHADIKRIRRFAMETRYWLSSAPGFVSPLPFLMPTYGHGIRGREALYVALKTYALLTRDRNRGLPENSQLTTGEMWSRSQVMDQVPELPADGLTGGAIWYDGQMQDADRILIQVLNRAIACGADVANYIEAQQLRQRTSVIEGIDAVDRVSGREFVIRSRMTVLCCGPWTTSFLAQSKLSTPRLLAQGLVKGINVVMRGRRFEFGLGLASRHMSDALYGNSKRLYLVTPWHECSVVGTTHEAYSQHPSEFAISATEVASFLAEINEAYPALELSMDDVLYCYGGLTPADDGSDSTGLTSRASAIVDHRHTDGLEGLMTVVGVKWTTAHHLAQRAVKRAMRYFPDVRIRRDQPALFQPEDYPDYLLNSAGDRLAAWVARVADEEMAINLSDAILRRTNLAARGTLTEADLELAATAMARAHDWSEDELRRQRSRLGEELEAHLTCFRSPKVGEYVPSVPQ